MPRWSNDETPRPSDFELQILGVIWKLGPCTARQVLESLPDGKKRAYTSVLSVMQVMEKKGLLTHAAKRQGLAHVYRAKMSRDKIMGPMLRNLVTRVFAGEPAVAVQSLISESDVTSDQISQIREFLDGLDTLAESDSTSD